MKKKLLLLNRRCIKNPLGGGAEVYTHEIFRRLTDAYDITYVTSSFEYAQPTEVIDDITYIRKGGELSMHIWAWYYYRKHKNEFDVVVDQFNGLGFFTFFNTKSVMLIHQLYDEFWVSRFGAMGYPFKFVERLLLKFYSRMKVITVSESTRDDLLPFGFKPENISIVYNGIDHTVYEQKTDFPCKIITYLGRMEPTKNPKDVLLVYQKLRRNHPELVVNFVGGGPENDVLKSLEPQSETCIYNGFVSEERKYNILRESDLLLVPSIREGWGQIVIQANMVGTPVIGYRVPGIRDSVKDGFSGILVDPGNVDAMAVAVETLFADKELLTKLSAQALQRSAEFSWRKSADEMRDIL